MVIDLLSDTKCKSVSLSANICCCGDTYYTFVAVSNWKSFV